MLFLIPLYLSILLFLFIGYRYGKRRSLDIYKEIYTTFEEYFFSLQCFFTAHKEYFYRKDKGSEVIYTNKKNFFQEPRYTPHTFQAYQALFHEDARFIASLFPDSQAKTPHIKTLDTRVYKEAHTWTELTSWCDKFLTLGTLGVRKLFSS